MPFQLKKTLFLYTWLILGIATMVVPLVTFAGSRIKNPTAESADAGDYRFNNGNFHYTYGQNGNNNGQNNNVNNQNAGYQGYGDKYQASSGYSYTYKDYSYLQNNNNRNNNNRRELTSSGVYSPWWWVWSTKYAPARPGLSKFFVSAYFLLVVPMMSYILFYGFQVARRDETESEIEEDTNEDAEGEQSKSVLMKDLIMMLGGSAAATFLIAIWIAGIDGLVAFDTYNVHQNGFYGQFTVLALTSCLWWSLFAGVFAFCLHHKTICFSHTMDENNYKMHDEESMDSSTQYTEDRSKVTI